MSDWNMSEWKWMLLKLTLSVVYLFFERHLGKNAPYGAKSSLDLVENVILYILRGVK